MAEGAVLVATPSKDAKEVRRPIELFSSILHSVGVKQIKVPDL